jgi:predicted dehydrogenase
MEQSVQRVGVGIVGLSATRGWAANAHLPALRALPGYEVVALSASSRESALAAAETHGVKLAFGNHRELVQCDEVDLVVVTVKVPAHRELVTAAIEAGKPVLCEWPLGNGLEEAEELEQLARASGVRGFAGLQAVSTPAVRFVRDLIASGEIGEVLSTTVVGSGDAWGPTVHPATLYLVDADNGATMLTIPVGHTIDGLCLCLGEFTELSATTATRRPTVSRTDSGDAWGPTVHPTTLYLVDADNGATMLTIPVGHTIDGLCLCLGEFTELSATVATRRATVSRTDSGEPVPMTAADQVAITGRLENGAVAAMHYRGGRSPGTNFLWEVAGSRGTLVVTGASGHLQYGRVAVQVAVDGQRELSARPIPPEYELVALDPQSLPYAVAHAYARLLGDLRDGTTEVPTFADAVRRHRTLAAVERAAATGERQLLVPALQTESHP